MSDIQKDEGRTEKRPSADIANLVMVVVLWRLLLPLRRIVHRLCLARLTQQRLALLFAVLYLLVLLHEIAWSAAACAEAVFAAVSRQVVFRANVSSVYKRKDPSKADAGQSSERGALTQLEREFWLDVLRRTLMLQQE